MGQTHYDILGISKTATNSQIREAWRNHQVNSHPDKVRQQWRGRSESDIDGEIARRTQLLQDASQAKDVLLNPVERFLYDESQEVDHTTRPQPGAPQQQTNARQPYAHKPPSSDDFMDLKIDVDDLFGGSSSGANFHDQSRPGATPMGDQSRPGNFGMPSFGQPRAAPRLVFALKALERVGFQGIEPWPDMVSALRGLSGHVAHLFLKQESRPGRSGHVVPEGHFGLFQQGKKSVLAMPGTYARQVFSKTTFLGVHAMEEPLAFGGIFAFAPSARRPMAVVLEGSEVRVTDKPFAMHASRAPGGVFAMDVFDREGKDLKRVDNNPQVWTRPASFSGHKGIFAQIYNVHAGASLLATDAYGNSKALTEGVHVVTHPSVKVQVLT